nr:MAG TPA: adenine specific DNA methyltransferase [Inoviridae sp.]
MTDDAEIFEKLQQMQIELVSIDALVPDPLNTKNHPKDQIRQIADSMKKRWTDPILVDDGMMIVAGHGRRLAAMQAGFKKVPVIVLHDLTEAERLKYQIFDNKSSEMAEWNYENLQAVVDRLTELGEDIEGTGWTADELEEQLAEFDKPGKEIHVEKLDDAPPVSDMVRSRRGDLWICGNHRILCGDSCREEDVEKLMDGQLADLVFTDPPYGVSYKGSNNPNGREWEIIKNDKLRNDELFLFLLEAFKNIKRFLRRDRAFYIWYANSNHANFEMAINGAELKSKQIIIWDKGMVLGHSDYHWAYEPCFYGCHADTNCKWFEDRTQKTLWREGNRDFGTMDRDELLEVLKKLKEGTDIWAIKRDAASTYLHPTQKPVALAQRAMLNSSNKGEIVLDLFGGSGSTMAAGEAMGRKVRLMELDEKYVDVEVKCWQELTDKKAYRESDGMAFDDVEERDYDGND